MMDSKEFAKKLSDLVMLIPPIAYGAMLWDAPAFAELLIASFIFFAFVPQYLADNFRKQPRNPQTKLKIVWEFLLTFAAGFAVLWVLNAPAQVIAFSVSLAAGHLVAYFVTPYWMISTHAMMSMQPLTALVLLGRVESIVVLAIYLVFGWARIHIKAHTPMQYLAGGVVGAALTWICLAAAGY